MSVHKVCRDCGDWLALCKFEQIGPTSYRVNCKKCRSAYNAAAQAVCRARKAAGEKAPGNGGWDTRTPYTPARMDDFGSVPERVALVADVGLVAWAERVAVAA